VSSRARTRVEKTSPALWRLMRDFLTAGGSLNGLDKLKSMRIQGRWTFLSESTFTVCRDEQPRARTDASSGVLSSYLGIYSAIAMATIGISAISRTLWTFARFRSGKAIHERLLDSVIACTLRFLDITPQVSVFPLRSSRLPSFLRRWLPIVPFSVSGSSSLAIHQGFVSFFLSFPLLFFCIWHRFWLCAFLFQMSELAILLFLPPLSKFSPTPVPSSLRSVVRLNPRLMRSSLTLESFLSLPALHHRRASSNLLDLVFHHRRVGWLRRSSIPHCSTSGQEGAE